VNPWVAFPTCNTLRAVKALAAWKGMGYNTCILVDAFHPVKAEADVVISVPNYEGYWKSCNQMCKHIIAKSHAHIVVCAADDLFPDERKNAEVLQRQFLQHFNGTLGIMQPIGDSMKGTDQICGSPWIGREFIERSYQGNGPYHDGFAQFYSDEELLHVAKKLGILWQRRDVTHLHMHWARKKGPKKTPYQIENSKKWWDKDKALYLLRSKAGFPGHELLDINKPMQ
jgi:hypothetical protein